ncbi:MAG: helix-turn-helix domain-containing protein [Treponema sp.]|jgi:cytoskeletal protein RodZ|nr:helix-turn-helix domain-containing protein [Treponema sp.]
MDSLGDMLRLAREAKGYSLEMVGQETYIALRYLRALEQENFAEFPAESYLLGFLRNYGEFLDLDGTKLTAAYRTIKIQDEPIPVDALLHQPPDVSKIIRTLVIVVLILAVAGVGVYFYLNPPLPAAREAVPGVRAPVEYVMEEAFLERRFLAGDSVLVRLREGQEYRLELAHLGELVTIEGPGGNLSLDLNDEESLVLDPAIAERLQVIVEEFDKTDASVGVLLRLTLESAALGAGGLLPADAQGAAALSAAAIANAPVIFSSQPDAYPFTLQAVFQNYCMLRWEILAERDRPGRNEQYFQRNEQLSIQAQNGIRLWVSNAAAVKVDIIGGGRTVSQELGAAGEVVVCDVRWVRDEDGRYRLLLLRLE